MENRWGMSLVSLSVPVGLVKPSACQLDFVSNQYTSSTMLHGMIKAQSSWMTSVSTGSCDLPMTHASLKTMLSVPLCK